MKSLDSTPFRLFAQIRTLLLVGALGASLPFLQAQDNPAEKAKQAAEKAADAVKEGAEKVEKAADKAAEKAKPKEKQKPNRKENQKQKPAAEKAKPEAAQAKPEAAKPEPKETDAPAPVEPKEESKPEPKEEPKPAPKEEPKPEPKEEPKPAPKEEPKTDPKPEEKPDPTPDPTKVDPKTDTTPTTEAPKVDAPDEAKPETTEPGAEKEEPAKEEPAKEEGSEELVAVAPLAPSKFLSPEMSERLDGWNTNIKNVMEPAARWMGKLFFTGPLLDQIPAEGGDPVPIPDRRGNPITLWYVVLWLASAGIILTLVFGFLNIRALPLALRTVRGKYSSESDPGEITHFQALSSALSGTVGLGNIAGVAIAISVGGPGAVFWMFVAGFLGMTTKFCECTLGVKYRRLKPNGKVLGGPMYYLADGFKERNMAGLGKTMAVLFAIFCSVAAIGAGNLFQVNQAMQQLIEVTGGAAESPIATPDGQVLFGLVLAALIALVIVFGIKGIGKVTAVLVPVMCVVYVLGCLVVLLKHSADIVPAFQTIWDQAFNWKAVGTGGIIIAVLMGFRRAAFSNEAGFGSASIAHSAVKTKYPASEGIVALLEPFIDTVIVCTMTALVIITTGVWETIPPEGLLGWGEGIKLTSRAFESVMSWFPYVLSFAAIIFAISTLITWSYYGEQAFAYLFGGNSFMAFLYKIIFVAFIVAGAVMSLGAVVDFADGPFFALCIINLIGVYALLPTVREELKRFREFTKLVDRGEITLDKPGADLGAATKPAAAAAGAGAGTAGAVGPAGSAKPLPSAKPTTPKLASKPPAAASDPIVRRTDTKPPGGKG